MNPDQDFERKLREHIKSLSTRFKIDVNSAEFKKEVEDAHRDVLEVNRQALESIKPGSMKYMINHPLFQQSLEKMAEYTLNKGKECLISAYMLGSDLGIKITYGDKTSVNRSKGKTEYLGSDPGELVFETHSHPNRWFYPSQRDLVNASTEMKKFYAGPYPCGASAVYPDCSIQTLCWFPTDSTDKKKMKKLHNGLVNCFRGKGHLFPINVSQDPLFIVLSAMHEFRKFGCIANILRFKYSNGRYSAPPADTEFLEHCLSKMKEYAAQRVKELDV